MLISWCINKLHCMGCINENLTHISIRAWDSDFSRVTLSQFLVYIRFLYCFSRQLLEIFWFLSHRQRSLSSLLALSRYLSSSFPFAQTVSMDSLPGVGFRSSRSLPIRALIVFDSSVKHSLSATSQSLTLSSLFRSVTWGICLFVVKLANRKCFAISSLAHFVKLIRSPQCIVFKQMI